MPLRGDFRLLKRLGDRLEQLASPHALQTLCSQLANAALAEVQQNFSREQSPDGVPWVSAKASKRPLLRRSGRLQNSIEVTIDRRGFSLRSRVPYASFHQAGTRQMPKRAILPLQRTMPMRWRSAFQNHAKRWLRGVFFR